MRLVVLTEGLLGTYGAGVGVTAADDDVLERRILEPDPGLIKSLGAHHSFQSAVADLVDNSIDATASRVLIRFETENGLPTGLTVVDDGHGMTDLQIDEAMRLGRQREYSADAQGHFGIGLKAASFSHADTVTVCTSPGPGQYHGRRLRRADVQRDFSCEVLDPASVRKGVDGCLALLGATTGTVVRWSDTTFPRVTGLNWLEDSKTHLRMHLGLVYHRLITASRLRIDIEVYDRDLDEAGAPEPVVSIDPFDFPVSAVSGYPKTLTATAGETTLQIECHILPPKSSGPQFRLYGRDGGASQGFYIYRNDRLLQAGGWNRVITNDRNRALARVILDDFEALSRFVRMSPEKSGITFSHELEIAIASATTVPGAGAFVSFQDYINRAESVLVESRKRVRARRPVADPGRGLHSDVRRVIQDEIPIRKAEGCVEIRWRAMPREKFMELDREDRTVYLNRRYREMLTGGQTGLSDAPLLKTLVFLLTEEHFGGQFWGARDRDLIDMWDAVLGVAVQTEWNYRNEERRR